MLEKWLRIKTQHLKRQVAVETHTLLNIWFEWELFVLKMSVNMIVELKTMESVEMFKNHEMSFIIGLGDMAQKIITIIIFISVDIDNYHDKCQIFISFKFKARFLLQSESFRNQTIHFP